MHAQVVANTFKRQTYIHYASHNCISDFSTTHPNQNNSFQMTGPQAGRAEPARRGALQFPRGTSAGPEGFCVQEKEGQDQAPEPLALPAAACYFPQPQHSNMRRASKRSFQDRFFSLFFIFFIFSVSFFNGPYRRPTARGHADEKWAKTAGHGRHNNAF
jgi:hypothetical protein